MTNFTPKSWHDFVGGGTPTDAAALVDLETRLATYAEIAAGGTYPVKAYGAVGDSVTDDTAKLNIAIAAAGAAGGGRVVVPPGTYSANDLVLGYSNLWLDGSGPGTILKQKSGVADNTYLVSAFGSGTTTASNLSNIRISNMQLLGRSDTDSFTQYVHLLELAGCSDVLLDNILFRNFRGDAICLASNLNGGTQVERHNERIYVVGCKFDGGAALNNRNGITIIDGTDVVIWRNYFTRCTKTGMPGAIDIEPNVNAYHRLLDISVDDNVFDGVGGSAGVVGIFLNQAQSAYTQAPSGISVTRNRFRNCTNSAGPVYVHQVGTPSSSTELNDIVVDQNRMRNNAGQWFEAEGVRGLKVTRNRVRTAAGGLALGYAYKCADVEVWGNDIKDAAGTSDEHFAIYTADRVTIEKNTITDGGSKLVAFNEGPSSAARVSTEIHFKRNTVIGAGITTASKKDAAHTLTASGNLWEDNDTTLAPNVAHFAKVARLPLGGVFTSTPGAVSTVSIPHGLGVTPTVFDARPGDANARGAPAFYITATSTNVVLNFASALAAATAYTWNWMATY